VRYPRYVVPVGLEEEVADGTVGIGQLDGGGIAVVIAVVVERIAPMRLYVDLVQRKYRWEISQSRWVISREVWKKKIDLESVVYLDIFACLVCDSLIFPVDMF
jgi:hypothetical protein